jgi:protein CpxP
LRAANHAARRLAATRQCGAVASFTNLYGAAKPSSLRLQIIGFLGESPERPETPMRDVNAARAPRQGSVLLMRLMAVSVLVVAIAGAAFSAQAQGHPGGGHHGGHGGHGHRGGHAMMIFGGSPAQVGRAVDRMLDGLNASAAQRDQIKQIAIKAATDLKAQRDAGRELHEKGLQVFAAPSVDAGAAEALRQQMLAQHDQASKRRLQAMLDVAQVLTPEQRATLVARMKQRHAVMKDRMQRMQHERAQPHAPRGEAPAPAK